MAGCSLRPPSSYQFSTLLCYYLYTDFISCLVLFGGKALNMLQKLSCNKFFVLLLITQELSVAQVTWDFVRFCTSRVATSR